MRGQVKVHQKKIIARRRRRALFLSLYSLLFLGVVASGLSYLSHLDAFAIKKVIVKGNERVSAAEIERVVFEKTAGNYLKLFSRSNSLLYPKDEVKEGVLGMPLLKDASVSRDGLGAVVIALLERKESAVWCGATDGEPERCYSLDENGLIFDSREGFASSSADIVYRGVVKGDPIGQEFLPEAQFKKIVFFIKQLSGLSVGPREASISDSGYMTVTLEKGGKIMLDTKDDLSIVLANIATIITDRSVAPSFFEFLDGLDYIKIDSGNKAVYKLKSSTTAAQ